MQLVSSPSERRPLLFKNSPTGRKVDQAARAMKVSGETLPSIASIDSSELPPIVRYAYRSFDRQYLISDPRVIDRPGPSLWLSLGSRQLFLTGLLTGLVDVGPAATVTQLIPDLHHFRGSFGGKDVIPLWRDAECSQPNVTAGLLTALAERLGQTISPEDLLAYCYALLSAPSYTRRFREELEVPGPHVPLTIETKLFKCAVKLGRELIWLHTYGERFVPPGERAGRVPQGQARYVKTIPQRADAYPEKHSYDEIKQELHVGEGVFAPVSPEVRAFQVSGLDVIGSWLDYRMKGGAGRKSSPLDDIRPTIWPEAFSKELLELLWVLERTVALGPELDSLLEDAISGPTIPADGLPQPSEAERKAPS
jgi:hypothetical protein